jgi:hypothetical protein
VAEIDREIHQGSRSMEASNFDRLKDLIAHYS